MGECFPVCMQLRNGYSFCVCIAMIIVLDMYYRG